MDRYTKGFVVASLVYFFLAPSSGSGWGTDARDGCGSPTSTSTC